MIASRTFVNAVNGFQGSVDTRHIHTGMNL
jgi:hypothetical protein